MEQLVSLSLGSGDCQRGFQTVAVQLWTQASGLPIKFSGSLPPAPQLAELYGRWQVLYQALSLRLSQRQERETDRTRAIAPGIEFDTHGLGALNRVSVLEFDAVCAQLKVELNTWLQSADFFPIEQRLRLWLKPAASIKFIIETDDRFLRQLPWHLWSLLEQCPLAEIAFSAQTYERVQQRPTRKAGAAASKARILAVLGHSAGIDIQRDRSILEQLPNAEVVFLSEPDRPTLDRWLWDEQGWDVLFFAGHSSSHASHTSYASHTSHTGGGLAAGGQLYLNPQDRIEIGQLCHALRAAIERGLKLAIFNSCDGLGLAQALENLHLPQLIVMREPVPDRVAQLFLKNLVQALAAGQSFYPAVRRAREQLQGVEGQFSCASWLPTLCQNPAVPSWVWPGYAATTETLGDEARGTEDFEPGPSPYKGLAAFEPGDGDRYFGRSAEVQALWEKFRQLHKDPATLRLLPIYGPSGSGKSSLAKAGLLALLARLATEPLHIMTVVPGIEPLYSLAKALAHVAEEDPRPVQKTREFAEELEWRNPAGQADGLQRIADSLPGGHPLILLVDQCEEVYSLCENEGERQLFLDNLRYAAGHRAQRVAVLMTFRSDFLGATYQHPLFNRLFSQQGFLVPAMGRAGLREAIARPAQAAGYGLEAATVDLLIEQTAGRDGALPLLQFALTRIWDGLSEHKAPAQTLQDIGGVGGALAGEAERIYQGLTPTEQDIARRLFLNLVQPGEGTRDTRRRVRLEALISAQDNPVQVRQVVNHFAAPGVRLVTLATVDQQETVEVTHEALFDHWQRLQGWLDKGRDQLRFQRRLDEAAKDWEKNSRAEGLLWRQPNLNLLRSYHQQARAEMTPLQLAFFSAAQRSERVQRRLTRIALGALFLLSAGLAGFGIVANRSAMAARRSQQMALGRQFILQSEQLTEQSGMTVKEAGALLAVKAFQTFAALQLEPPTEVNHALYNSLLVPNLVMRSEGDSLNNIAAFSPDRRQVVLLGRDNTPQVWDIPTQQLQAEFVHDATVNRVAFSPDGRRVATASDDGIARVWDLERQAAIAQLPHDTAVNDLAFSPDSQQLITADGSSTVKLWNLSRQSLLQSLSHDHPIEQVRFSPSGTQVATASPAGIVQVWELETERAIARLTHNDSINELSFRGCLRKTMV